MTQPLSNSETLQENRVLPFPALTGQEHVKQALLMLAVNPRLSGLLIRGEKGTAKSTAARGLARLLPPIKINQGCRFGCVAGPSRSWCSECRERPKPATVEKRPPFETLPLGITEDQLLGTFDLEQALKHGEKRFAPGLLARVNQGVLYVDELNLLDDHIIDVLLDSAASGINYVEREGISIVHPAVFLLVGTMNPEEGELRPQLQDRFGLCAEIRTLPDPEKRIEIIERSLEFEANPRAFRAKWAKQEKVLTATIARARRILPKIEPHRDWHRVAVELSVSLEVHGHRADILMIKAAATLAALDGRMEIAPHDIETAATLVYPHRLRRMPFEEAQLSEPELRERAREAIHSFVDSVSKKKSLPSKGRP